MDSSSNRSNTGKSVGSFRQVFREGFRQVFRQGFRQVFRQGFRQELVFVLAEAGSFVLINK